MLSSVPAVDETPIDHWLQQQRDLTAVERFSQRHEADLLPRQARYYRDLIPLAQPAPGQQYGFEVDLDACTGCKACVAACHSLNGLDEGESWRSVTVLHGNDPARPSQQTVTAGCHHCVDPACLAGCPVDAYEKDPITGIVVHLDDQCIGCSYCTLTCPYEVPMYNRKRGIVRKCDMCRDRLATGEAPACVQACPNQAIRIVLTEIEAIRVGAQGTALVAGAPRSSITQPSSVYRTERRDWQQTLSGSSAPRPLPSSQTPLAVMLVLTQLAVGTFVGALGRAGAAAALATGAVALGASVLHLGRPRYAYRALIGLRHSWLSREVATFGAFTGAVAGYAVTGSAPLAAIAAVTGVAGIACSVMIYAKAHRSWWRVAVTGPKFVLTAAIAGLAVRMPMAAAVVLALKLLLELTVWASPVAAADLRMPSLRRYGLGVAGIVALALAAVAPVAHRSRTVACRPR